MQIFYVMVESSAAQAELLQKLFDSTEVLDSSGRSLFQSRVLRADDFNVLIRETIPTILRARQTSVISR